MGKCKFVKLYLCVQYDAEFLHSCSMFIGCLLRIPVENKKNVFLGKKQCCGSGFVLDPYSEAS